MLNRHYQIAIYCTVTILLPTASFSGNHGLIQGWGDGSDIMGDAFSNGVMSASPVDTSLASQIDIIDDTNSISTISLKDKLEHQIKYKEIITPSSSYLRVTLTKTGLTPTSQEQPLSLSYITQIFIPHKQPEDNFFQRFSSKQIIRDGIDRLLFAPSIVLKLKNNSATQNTIETTSTWHIRLSQHFETTDTELNFADKNFQESTTGFAKIANQKAKNIQISATTISDAPIKTDITQVLSQAQGDDKSGVTSITWLAPEDDSSSEGVLSTDSSILSYQFITDLNAEANLKEVDQEFPEQDNPFSNSSSIESHSPF